MRDLATLSSAELKEFLDSFDNVLCDCDGVIWVYQTPIAGAKESLQKLRQCGKRVQFVSNNSSISSEVFQGIFRKLDVDTNDVIYPTIAIIDYLKSVDFKKTILVTGTNSMKADLKAAGYHVADLPQPSGSPTIGCVNKLMEDVDKIGAVIWDVDFTINYATILKAALCLKRSDVLYIVGATDKKLVAPGLMVIGPGYFQDIATDFSERKPLVFGKPGLELSKFVNKRFHSTDSSRTLMIGDSMEQDMKFASICGYKKLLVLSGATCADSLSKCTANELAPDYYVKDIVVLRKLIEEKLEV